MKTIMVSWLGGTDHDAAAGIKTAHPGPIARAVSERGDLNVVHVINNYQDRSAVAYRKWLRTTTKTSARVTSSNAELAYPTDFGAIYTTVKAEVDALLDKHGRDASLVFNITPGTHAMAAIAVILQQTRYPDAQLIEATPEGGVRRVHFPFDIAADYVPELVDRFNKSQAAADEAFAEGARGEAADSAGFEDIKFRSASMKRAIGRAKRVATRSIPLLIEGEPGTGKRLLANAIQNAGLSGREFRRVSCGAMPEDELERELFGFEESSRKIRKGALEDARHGTLFLEEVDCLSPMLQVRLLRALEDKKVAHVGGTKPVDVSDIRCISSTTKQLHTCVAEGTFRTDLYYRLAGDVIGLPPLRERLEDMELLINHAFDQKKELLRKERGLENIRLTAAAKNVLKRYHWPGNIRELENVLFRVATHSDRVEVRPEDIQSILQLAPIDADTEILNRPFREGFSLENVLDEVARHYISRAQTQTGGRVTRAASLLGYEHYQVLNRKIKNLGLKNDA
jgi:DNA-binding NtrC family response regulator